MFDSQSQSGMGQNEHLEAIRIAAYFFKRLKKPHVLRTDISASVDKILKDEVHMVTCRVFGYLLLGIVRIYSKKVEYLLCDSQEVLLGIKNFAVRSRKDLPEPETQKAPYFSITLPETYELDAFNVEVIDIDAVDGNVLPIEEITLKESGLENASTKQHDLDMCLHEDFAGSYHPCSPMYSPFGDILSSYGIDLNLRKLLNIDGLTTTMEIIKEDRFSQRKCMDRLVLTPVEEEHQNIDMTPSNSEKIKDPELSSSVQGIYAEVNPEILQYSGENYANLVESSEVEDVPDDDHVKPLGEDTLIDQDQIMVSEPEHVENEMHRLDCQDASQNNLQAEVEKLRDNACSKGGESVDTSVLSRPKEPQEFVNSFVEESCEDGDHNLSVGPSKLQPEIEKLRDNACSRGESIDPSVVCGPNEPQEVVNSFVEENCEDGELNNISAIPNEFHNATKEDDSVSTKLSTPDIKIPHALGFATPRFVGIATPAPKERARKSTKRKCIIDEPIVMSAEAMKRSIHDASDLVSKRRKIAHTPLAVWRATRSFPRHFFNPLFTGISLELRSLYYGNKLKMSKSFKTTATLEKLDVSKMACVGIPERRGVAPESPARSCVGISLAGIAPGTPLQCVAATSEQTGIAPETPVRRSTVTKSFERPMTPETPNYETVRPSLLFESPRREPSPSLLDQQFDLNLVDEVTSSHTEDKNSEWDGWSGRTRLVERYLRRSFLKLEERAAAEETLSLSRLVEGTTKKESARFFYEVLVLSSKGIVGVNQDQSYGDILVCKLQNLDDHSCGVESMNERLT